MSDTPATVQMRDGGPPLDGSKYRLLSPIGRGGMGEVWLAEHVELRAEVVIKLLDPNLPEREDLSDRLRLEGQALARLRHPNIVSVLDAGRTTSGYPFSDFVARLMAKDPDLRPASAFLAAREVRDMHDFVLREAHGKGFAPAAITIAPSTPVQERVAVPKRGQEKASSTALEEPAAI